MGVLCHPERPGEGTSQGKGPLASEWAGTLTGALKTMGGTERAAI